MEPRLRAFLRHDPSLQITWPLEQAGVQKPLLAAKDAEAPCWRPSAPGSWYVRILLTGSSGQLGRALRASLPARLAGEPVELIATARKPEPAQGVIGLDLADPESCRPQ